MHRLALFDLDDTLIDSPDVAFRIAMGQFAAEWGVGTDDLTWLTVDAVHHWSQTPLHYFRAVVARFGLDDHPADLYQAYRGRYLAAVRPFDGVVEGLAALRAAGWRTAIVTNGPTGPQLAKIDQLKLADLVDAVCVSDAEGCAKPDAEIFHRAADKAGATLERAWMTGDSPAMDIAGGNALGLTTAWISRGRTWPDDDAAVPTHVLAATAEVFPLILADGRPHRPACFSTQS